MKSRILIKISKNSDKRRETISSGENEKRDKVSFIFYMDTYHNVT